MPQVICIRRGTKSELLNYGPLAAAEMGFCSDTKEVYVGDGTVNTLVGRAMSGTLDNRPEPSTPGRFYFVTSGKNSDYIYFDDGSSWRRINAQMLTELSGTLDDVLDGTAFKRVVAGDITGGHVNKVSDGSNTKTASEIREHIDNGEIHRMINDSGSASTDVWSAQKVRTEIFNAIKGMDWQDSVRSKTATTPPSEPGIHARYLIPDGAEGEWSGKTGQVVDWNGSAWDFFVPSYGWAVYVEDESKNYTYSNTGIWALTGGANQTIQAGPGLSGGGSGDTVTLQVGAGYGINTTGEYIYVVGQKGIVVDSSGVSVNIDGDSIQYDPNNQDRLMVVHIDGGTFSK